MIEQFIAMVEGGTVLIGKDLDIYDLLESDDVVRMMELQERGKLQKFDSSDFQDEYLLKLHQDLELLRRVQELWTTVKNDPKLGQFQQELRTNPLLKGKLIVFTESRETGLYLYHQLQAEYGAAVMFYASDGGRHAGTVHSVPIARNLIARNFDPKSSGLHPGEEGVRILITTDVLAEGMNLHLASVVMNYDLPWNPTRVLQRVGRINRVGTKHANVHVFNFFPTARSDAHLGLEARIKAKLQSFHDTLGEDSRYLSSDEEVSAHSLFGERIYAKLTSKESLEEAEERSELEYLQLLRTIRDKQPDLFERIKCLPRKGRSARPQAESQLITLFRQGQLRKVLATGPKQAADEINFFAAVDLLACSPELKRATIPGDYFELLKRNKERFELLTTPEERKVATGASYDLTLRNILRSAEVRTYKGFTDEDEAYLAQVKLALEAGSLPRKTLQRVKKDVDTAMGNPLKILGAFRRYVPPSLLQDDSVAPIQHQTQQREVILSAYLVGDQP